MFHTCVSFGITKKVMELSKGVIERFQEKKRENPSGTNRGRGIMNYEVLNGRQRGADTGRSMKQEK